MATQPGSTPENALSQFGSAGRHAGRPPSESGESAERQAPPPRRKAP